MNWNVSDFPLPARGFIRIEANGREIARIYKSGKGKYYGLKQLDAETQANATLIVTAVNSCISLNPENPQAVAGGIEGLVAALRSTYNSTYYNTLPPYLREVIAEALASIKEVK